MDFTFIHNVGLTLQTSYNTTSIEKHITQKSVHFAFLLASEHIQWLLQSSNKIIEV